MLSNELKFLKPKCIITLKHGKKQVVEDKWKGAHPQGSLGCDHCGVSESSAPKSLRGNLHAGKGHEITAGLRVRTQQSQNLNQIMVLDTGEIISRFFSSDLPLNS